MASETPTSPKLHDRFFDVAARYLETAQGQPGGRADAAQDPPRP